MVDLFTGYGANAARRAERGAPIAWDEMFPDLTSLTPVEARTAYQDVFAALAKMTQEELRGPTDALASSYLAQDVTRTHPAHPMGWPELAGVTVQSTATVEHMRQTCLTEPPEDVAALAAEIVARHTSLCDAALEICAAIGDRIQYVQGVTGVHTTARESWEDGCGGAPALPCPALPCPASSQPIRRRF